MEKEIKLIKGQAVKDIEDLIHDITGAPEDALKQLGVNREYMLSAANDLLEHVKGL